MAKIRKISKKEHAYLVKKTEEAITRQEILIQRSKETLAKDIEMLSAMLEVRERLAKVEIIEGEKPKCKKSK